MPLLLYTYLATEVLAPFFASFVILVSILFLGRLIPLLDIIFDFGIGAADFIRLCAYVAPKLMLFAIPMASMMGVIIAFTRMVNDNEAMALKASGIGLYRMLPPVLAVAVFTAGLTYFSSTQLIPRGTVAMQKLFFQLAKEKIEKGVQAKQFSEGLKNVVLYVDEVDPQNHAWRGVYLSDMRHKNTPMTIISQTGSLAANIDEMQITLNLQQGTMNRAVDDLSQTIHFEKYTLNLPLQPPTHIDGDSITEIGKNGLSQKQLLERAAQLGRESQEGLSLLIEYHKRLALPAGCLVLTLLGLPLGLMAGPGRRPMGVPLGLLFFILYYVLFTAGKAFGENGSLPVMVAIWLPNGLLAAYTIFLTRRVSRETGRAFFELLFDLFSDAAAKLPWKKGKNRP